jgi:hypothetical protein
LARFIAHIRRTHQPFMLKIACPSMDGQCKHSVGIEWRKTNHEHMRTKHPECEHREKNFPDFDMDAWKGSVFYRGERFWLDPVWLYERIAETLCGARANQKGGGWHTKQSYIALVLEQIGAYGLFGETSGNARQWFVPREIYETLQRRVLKLDDRHEIIEPWKWAKVERKANCPPLPGLPTGTHRAVSPVVPAGAVSIAPFLNHVRDSSYLIRSVAQMTIG